MGNSYLFTSESVAEGHPDKVCDQISDALLDEYLRRDAKARIAVETLATSNQVVLAGEVSSTGLLSRDETEKIVRNVVKNIGYEQDGFHYKNINIDNFIHSQSQDIARGVVEQDDKPAGAGDQGIMFGYATDEAEGTEFMPAPMFYANAILRNLAEARHQGVFPELRPDAKAQVTMLYENGIPVKADSIVVSTQHTPETSTEEVREIVRYIVKKTIPEQWLCSDEKFLVNPTGRFVIGGPDGDTGLTGRKIIVDTYGGAAPHGGGAFSGKDATKVDRSANYMARHMAKNVVASGVAKKCLIQIAYAIGVAEPLALYVNTFGTGLVDEDKIAAALKEIFNLTPQGISDYLNLTLPIFQKTAAYGHFGRAPEEDGAFSWEKINRAEEIKKALS